MLSNKRTCSIGVILVLVLISCAEGMNKYSQEANKPKPKTDFSLPTHLKELRELDKPFRMHKLNLVWAKAKHVSSCYSCIYFHDLFKQCIYFFLRD